MKFYDREKELELLRNSEAQAEKAASFTVLMGRRRIGKTSLILKALEGKPFAYLFVSRDNEAMLCDKMQRELQNSLGINVFGRISRFRELFEVIMQASQTRHFTVVFDEIRYVEYSFQQAYLMRYRIFTASMRLFSAKCRRYGTVITARHISILSLVGRFTR